MKIIAAAPRKMRSHFGPKNKAARHLAITSLVAITGLLSGACGDSPENENSSESDNSDQAGDTNVNNNGNLVPIAPPIRSEMMGIFDPVRRRLVFFGGDDDLPVNCTPAAHVVGIDELVVFDAVDPEFFRVDPGSSTTPPGRSRGMAVYDSDGDRMLIFGGRARATEHGPYTNFNDVWALNLTTLKWQQLQAFDSPVPIARNNPAGGYNELTGEMIVFGGNSSPSGLSYSPHNDVWAFDLGNQKWRSITSAGTAPTARLFHSAAVDAVNNRLFIYGGGGENAYFGPFYKDLWSFDLSTGTWALLHDGAGNAPAGRIWSTLTYDREANQVLLFGGHDDGSLGNNNDTWVFDLNTGAWEMLVAPEPIINEANGFCDFPPDFTTPNLEAPERRSAHLAALDPTRKEWLVFGGKTDCGIVDDVWAWDIHRKTWLRMIPASAGETCIRGEQPQLCVGMCQ